MGPPETAEPALCVVTKELDEECGEAIEAGAVLGARGSVSKDKVRRQEARRREKEVGRTGSWVEV